MLVTKLNSWRFYFKKVLNVYIDEIYHVFFLYKKTNRNFRMKKISQKYAIKRNDIDLKTYLPQFLDKKI